jgi:hypothetical protein
LFFLDPIPVGLAKNSGQRNQTPKYLTRTSLDPVVAKTELYCRSFKM